MGDDRYKKCIDIFVFIYAYIYIYMYTLYIYIYIDIYSADELDGGRRNFCRGRPWGQRGTIHAMVSENMYARTWGDTCARAWRVGVSEAVVPRN